MIPSINRVCAVFTVIISFRRHFSGQERGFQRGCRCVGGDRLSGIHIVFLRVEARVSKPLITLWDLS